MHPIITEYLWHRIDEVITRLPLTNARYALEKGHCDRLYEAVEPIILHGGDLSICAGDCANLNELLEHETAREAIVQEELYKQGYLDCVKLLSALGVLAAH